MDVMVKEGPLFLQGVKFGKRVWRKTWVMLFEPSSAGIGRVELYDMRDGGRLLGQTPGRPQGLRKAVKRVIRLADCLSITPAPEESCPSDCEAFYLNTIQLTYTMASLVYDDWVPSLCQLAFKGDGQMNAKKTQRDAMPMADNEVYSSWSPAQYQVTVQDTDESLRCSLSGSYLLSPGKDAVCLLDIRTGQTILCWPYRFLRRFGQINEGITIEAGRRCQSGEGHFNFLSKQGPQIYRAIEEAIMHQSVQELLSEASALPAVPDLSIPTTSPRFAINVGAKDPQCSPIRTNERACPKLPQRFVAFPDRPAATSREPDEVLYATIKPRLKPQGQTKAPMMSNDLLGIRPPILKEKRVESETEERPYPNRSPGGEDVESDYMNWIPEEEVQGEPLRVECVYSTLNTPPLPKRTLTEEARGISPNRSLASPITEEPRHSVEGPDNFKEILSRLLFKPLLPARPNALKRDSDEQIH